LLAEEVLNILAGLPFVPVMLYPEVIVVPDNVHAGVIIPNAHHVTNDAPDLLEGELLAVSEVTQASKCCSNVRSSFSMLVNCGRAHTAL
jgi:hypothetical protein